MHRESYPFRIPLRNKRGEIIDWTIVDEADYESVATHRWHRTQYGYAGREIRINGRSDRFVLLMHRFLLGVDRRDRRQIDHRNRDKLDNRRSNLRFATRMENMQNLRPRGASGHRNVYWSRCAGKWMVQVQAYGEKHYGGLFTDLEEAAAKARVMRAQLQPYSID